MNNVLVECIYPYKISFKIWLLFLIFKISGQHDKIIAIIKKKKKKLKVSANCINVIKINKC